MFLALELDFSAGIFTKKHFVSRPDVQGDHFAVVLLAWADRNNLTFLGFLLGRVRDDQASFGPFFLFNPFNDDPIA